MDGPTLPIEFSRISASRSCALTLVIDEEQGSPIQVAWCLSRRRKFDNPVQDIRKRECATLENIGRHVADTQISHQVMGVHEEAIEAWALSMRIDGVVWTALRPNFQEKKRNHFSAEAAITHLKSLDSASLAKAKEYILNAPEFVRSPLRAALAAEFLVWN